jgi:ribosomal protein S14
MNGDESRHHQRADQGQAHTQCAARGFVCLRQFKLGRFDLRKDAPAAFEE